MDTYVVQSPITYKSGYYETGETVEMTEDEARKYGPRLSKQKPAAKPAAPREVKNG